MSIEKIGNELWDFVDADGAQTILPPADAQTPSIVFPTRWRVFGPLKSKVEVIPPQHIADTGAHELIGDLRTLPDELNIEGESFVGQDIGLDGDKLDLGSFCKEFSTVYLDTMQDAAARIGRQMYAFAELVLEEETEVSFGAGADFWMQWWIDGKPVYDTLASGNRTHPPLRTDHTFRRSLSAGRHLLAVRVISGGSSWVLRTGVLTPRDEVVSSVTVSDRWQFLPDLDEIRPPHRKGAKGIAVQDWGHTMAIAADRCLAEETIECDVQVGLGGNFGILFGAQDNGHYYTLQIPRWGDLFRQRAFWAYLCKADGSGYLRNLKMMLVPHVVCHANAWFHLRVERRFNCIRTWIDGVRGPSVIDDSYGPGRVGLTGFSKYTVRNLKIDGKAVAGPAWKIGDFRGQPWFLPVPDENSNVLQLQCPELLRLSDDEILMVMMEQGPDSTRLLLSRDNGRTWAQHNKPQHPRDISLASYFHWFVPRPGVIRAFEIGSTLTGGVEYRPPLPDGAALAWRESTDKGLTWSEPRPCRLLGDWSRDIFCQGAWNHVYGGTRLKDGTLLALILHSYLDLYAIIPNRGGGTWGGTGFGQPYVSRSEDGGLTWSEPVPMDNAAFNDGGKPDSPHGGFSETVFAQLPGGRVVAQARTTSAPFMWRTHSDDDGKTWQMVTRESFPGSGGPLLLCTQSGYLVSVKRGPAVCLHISTDGGKNWDEGTIIDYPSSFNGQILEVEPDVVMVVYPESMGEFRPSYIRAQLIRITPDGPIPISRDTARS